MNRLDLYQVAMLLDQDGDGPGGGRGVPIADARGMLDPRKMKGPRTPEERGLAPHPAAPAAPAARPAPAAGKRPPPKPPAPAAPGPTRAVSMAEARRLGLFGKKG